MATPPTPPPGGDRLVRSSGWPLVVAAGMAVFMVTFDLTAVTVALPTMSTDLSVSVAAVEWVILIYAAAMVALVLPAGRWLNAADTRSAFGVAVLGFAAASTACGLAPSFEWLIGARFVQGSFGAVLVSLVPVIATRAVPFEQRGRALGIIGTLGPLGAVSGPALGGLLTDALDWRAIFFVVVPASCGAAWLGLRSMRTLGPLTRPQKDHLVEALVIGGASLALFGALTALAAQTIEPVLLAALIAVAIGGFLVWRRLEAAVVVRELLQVPLAATGLMALLLITTTSGVLYFLPPFALRLIEGASPAEIGLVILVQPLAMGVIGPIGGWLTDKWSGPRTAMIGACLIGIGSLLLAIGISHWGTIGAAACLLVTGVGLGLFAGPNQTTIMTAAPPALRGTAGALSGLARQLGLALGPALATIVWLSIGTSTTSEGLASALLVAPIAAALTLAVLVVRTVRGAAAAVPDAPSPAGDPTRPPGAVSGTAPSRSAL